MVASISVLSIAEHFYRSSALSDLPGVPEDDVYDNRLYRALDVLAGHKDEIQWHMKEQIVLPLRNGKEFRLRSVSKPEKELQVLMSRLKLTVPENFDRMIKM